MALSYVSYSGDGATTAYGYGSIQVLEDGVVPVASQLVVSVDGSTVPPSTYTLNTTTSVLTFFTAPGNGEAIEIARVTKSDDRYVDWTNATNLSQEQLNLDSDQLLFLAQESLDASQLTIRLNELGEWDAASSPIANVSNGVDSNDAVTVQQLNAAVFGGTPGVVTGQQYVNSDNGTTVFNLPSLHGQSASDVNVFLDGVRLEPEVGYTVADSSDGSTLILTLTSSPGASLVEITFVTGVLAAGLAEDAIENNNIKDGEITPDKMANAGARKVLINNPATGPEWADLTDVDVKDANDVDIPTRPVSDLAAATGVVSMGNNKIVSVADPSDVQDAVNLQTLQDEIASVRQQISDTTDFKKGTIAGWLCKTTSGNQAGQRSLNWYWYDVKGTDSPLDSYYSHVDMMLTSKTNTTAYPDGWPLDINLTMMSKIPSPGSMDMDLFNGVPLDGYDGSASFSPGSNPQSGAFSGGTPPVSVVTAGGKTFRRSDLVGSGKPNFDTSTAPVGVYYAISFTNPLNGQSFGNQGYWTKDWFPYYRLS